MSTMSFSHVHAKLYEGGENLETGDMILSVGGSADTSAIGASIKFAYGLNDTMSTSINVSSALLLNMISVDYRIKLAGNKTHYFNTKLEIIYNQFVWTEYLHQVSAEASLQYLFKANDRIGLGLDVGFFTPLAYTYSDKDKQFPYMLAGLANLNIRLWNQNSLHIAFGPTFNLEKQSNNTQNYFGKLMLSILF